jgi:hypothetical protein
MSVSATLSTMQGDDRKIEAAVLALIGDVAWQASEPKWQSPTEGKESAYDQESDSTRDKRLPEFARRIHCYQAWKHSTRIEAFSGKAAKIAGRAQPSPLYLHLLGGRVASAARDEPTSKSNPAGLKTGATRTNGELKARG